MNTLMFNDCFRNDIKSEEKIKNIVMSSEFKNLFLEKGINNVIIFGSLADGTFTEESDVDIAVIAEKSLAFDKELDLTMKLEEILNRDIDLIDINDENINNVIKISALNGKIVVMKDNLYEEACSFYDNLAKENEEFWRILDREVLGLE